jgi:DNA-binding response OmpR family regulator
VTEPTPTNPPDSSENGGRVLVLEPANELASSIVAALQEAAPNADVAVARSLEEAQRLVASHRPDLFVLDVDATYDLGQEFLYDLRTSHPNARAIVLTAIHLREHREQAAGLGAIHFLEKPFPHADFVDLVQAILQPSSKSEGERFQGTLSDLHIADIIQLKCMSGATSALEFTGPGGEKARVYFEYGQVRHATALGKEGIEAFNEIVKWKGGVISEVSDGRSPLRTINIDWQVLLMEAVRQLDETRNAQATAAAETPAIANKKVLVIDDSLMLLSFVKEILAEANYETATAPTAGEGLEAARAFKPDLILLDYVLPDMKGDEVCTALAGDPATAATPVVYMSGFGTDLQPDQMKNPNVIGSLSKPFTSDLLLRSVESYMPKAAESEAPVEAAAPVAPPEPPAAETDASTVETQVDAALPLAAPEAPPEAAAEPPAEPPTEAPPLEPAASPAAEETVSMPEAPTTAEEAIPAAAAAATAPWWSETPAHEPAAEEAAAPAADLAAVLHPDAPALAAEDQPPTASDIRPAADERMPASGDAYFCGDTSFFSLNWALQTIAKEKLTGILRCFWEKAPVELIARDGHVALVTTRDPELYCPEAPITLLNVDAEKNAQARANQMETGCPLFITLARDGLIIREPALQLVQHYGQKLFAQLWVTPRVRFMFEKTDALPAYSHDVPVGDEDTDHWTLSALRFIQFHELGDIADYEPGAVPAYTRDGYDRIQRMRLTVAEAQFASQFNGSRSIQQIAKNLRLDLKFARLTLFRFLALEIVECWPPGAAVKQERPGLFQRFGRSLGFGE